MTVFLIGHQFMIGYPGASDKYYPISPISLAPRVLPGAPAPLIEINPTLPSQFIASVQPFRGYGREFWYQKKL